MAKTLKRKSLLCLLCMFCHLELLFYPSENDLFYFQNRNTSLRSNLLMISLFRDQQALKEIIRTHRFQQYWSNLLKITNELKVYALSSSQLIEQFGLPLKNLLSYYLIFFISPFVILTKKIYLKFLNKFKFLSPSDCKTGSFLMSELLL